MVLGLMCLGLMVFRVRMCTDEIYMVSQYVNINNCMTICTYVCIFFHMSTNVSTYYLHVNN